MNKYVHYDEAMSNLTTSKDPACCLFGGRMSCVDKQSVKGDRTTTPAWKGCSKQMLVRIIRSFLPAISRNRLKCGFLKLHKKHYDHKMKFNRNIEMRSIEIGCEADDRWRIINPVETKWSKTLHQWIAEFILCFIWIQSNACFARIPSDTL